jgi:hypothetical protein
MTTAPTARQADHWRHLYLARIETEVQDAHQRLRAAVEHLRARLDTTPSSMPTVAEASRG